MKDIGEIMKGISFIPETEDPRAGVWDEVSTRLGSVKEWKRAEEGSTYMVGEDDKGGVWKGSYNENKVSVVEGGRVMVTEVSLNCFDKNGRRMGGIVIFNSEDGNGRGLYKKAEISFDDEKGERVDFSVEIPIEKREEELA